MLLYYRCYSYYCYCYSPILTDELGSNISTRRPLSIIQQITYEVSAAMLVRDLELMLAPSPSYGFLDLG